MNVPAAIRQRLTDLGVAHRIRNIVNSFFAYLDLPRVSSRRLTASRGQSQGGSESWGDG